MAKKQNTEPAKPKYGFSDSFPLTEEQVTQACEAFKGHLLNDTGEDSLASVLLALLHSFALTEDAQERESMLIAANVALTPFTGAGYQAVTQLAIRGYEQIVRVHTEQ